MRHLSVSKVISLFCAIIITVPILFIFSSFLKIDWSLWNHLSNYVLPEISLNTLKLVISVTLGTLLIAIPLAYVNSFYEYPLRKYFSFLAIMPMSIPAYITAFVYVALFDVTGLWSLKLKSMLGLKEFLPGIRNIYGISTVLSLCFYPYIYLLAKNAFQNQGARAIEVARMLSLSERKTFFKIVLPLSRPWILSGLILVLMETLADFGAVSIFNFSTFTTAIYRSWFGLFSLSSAQHIAGLLLIFVFILMILERWINRNKNYAQVGKGTVHITRIIPGKLFTFFILIFSVVLSFMAFILPMAMIIFWAINTMARDLDARYFSFVFNSLQISTLTVFALIFFSLFMAYAVRKYPGFIATIIKTVSSLGYAVPGTVLAVGVYLFLTILENFFSPGEKILTSGLTALIIGLSIRFFSLALSPIASAFLRIKDSHFHVLDLTRNSRFKNFMVAFVPMLRPGMLTAALLVFVETMKEMPITLMTRPFGKETLAIRIFEMTSEGEWERAALPSLFLVIFSMIPTIVLYKLGTKTESEDA